MMELFFGQLRIHSKKSDFENADYLRVIGAGLPRTGTSSLKTALELLGFGPCHHMSDLIDDPSRSILFTRALDGHQVDFRKLMNGYGSTVDAPTEEFYQEIHQAYPNAKIILSVRDSGEKWFESVENSIGPTATDITYLITVYPVRFLRLQCIANRKIFQRWTRKYGGYGPHIHDLHNTQVMSENKPGSVLLFNVKEGWSPLCKFLGVPVPKEIPFPNINDTKRMQRIIRIGRLMGVTAWVCILMIIGLIIRFFI